MIPTDKIIQRMKTELSIRDITLGELVEIAKEEGASLSTMVVAEAMAKEDRTYEDILTLVLEAFQHNLKAMETGLTKGRSFLLGTVGSDLARYEDQMISASRPLTRVFGDVVVGGSSIAVGSPTNMARICHEMISGEIKKIEIDLTIDLFSRRAINVPAILMGAIYGAKTDDIEMYHKIFELPEIKDIEVKINKIDTPEVQRIRIETSDKSAELDARNRGGGRVAIVDAKPSMKEAVLAAERLGIELTD